MRVTRIYALIDPISGLVKYIGKTVQPLNRRLYYHILDSKKYNYRNAQWIKFLSKSYLRPEIKLVEECAENWAEREKFWINHFRAICDLTNDTDGGEGALGGIVSQESREKISASKKEYWKIPGVRKKQSIKNEIFWTQERLRAHSEKIKATMTPERRAMIAAKSREVHQRKRESL